MKRSISLALLSLISFSSYSQQSSVHTKIAIIPEPVYIEETNSTFILPKKVLIETTDVQDTKSTVEFLKDRIGHATGSSVTTTSITSATASIKLIINNTPNMSLGNEGYTLSVTPKGITIKANQPAGLFYGAQTLIQLFPKEIESHSVISNVKWAVPTVKITDYPRFVWRGLMFDVSRHFFTKDEVKQYIDAMVRYKYNLLHLHLTDDEGWRIEIKSYPKLTEKGAWNVKKIGEFGNFTPPTADEARNYGGFYTQEDIKELVQYAKTKFVNILPEIDVPGHSLATVASYPLLSCTPEAKNYVVRSGEQIMDWSHGAPPIALVDNTLCPANEKVYEFLDKVVSELAVLFPFEYIHMGGDECPKNYWEKNDQIKGLMQKEDLKNMEEVQSYFTKRLEKIVESKGKKFMGWDEILEGGISPSAAVMSWRGVKGGIEAAKMKHQVVMSPTTFAYLDYMQADAITEPHVYATLRLSKAYEFEPIPEGVDPQYIRGGQANLWTEQVYNIRQAEYMTWPRGFAIAESVWSPKEKKDWTHFAQKTEKHFKRLDLAETKYAPSVYDPSFAVSKTSGDQLVVNLTTELSDLDIYYSFDNSFPDRFYPKYTEALIV
ncbi:MAG: beta-N-acetylhexosaminidase, partial [Daejeonella sp.]|nr:beta-N-acetylhexosaminidase [Daejeonella sp.]